LIYTNEETPTLFEYDKIDNRFVTCVIEKTRRNEKQGARNETRKITWKEEKEGKHTAVVKVSNQQLRMEGNRKKCEVYSLLGSPIACLGR